MLHKVLQYCTQGVTRHTNVTGRDQVGFGFAVPRSGVVRIHSGDLPTQMCRPVTWPRCNTLELFDIGPAHPAEGLLGPSVQRGQGLHGDLQLEQLSMLHRDLARDLLEQSRCPYSIPVLSLASVRAHDRLALVTRLAQKHAAAASGA